MQSRNDVITGFLGFFVPASEDGEDLNKFYELTCEEIDSQIWLICMTLTGWSYSDVVDLSEAERLAWAKKCEEYQDKVKDDIDRAKAR